MAIGEAFPGQVKIEDLVMSLGSGQIRRHFLRPRCPQQERVTELPQSGKRKRRTVTGRGTFLTTDGQNFVKKKKKKILIDEKVQT